MSKALLRSTDETSRGETGRPIAQPRAVVQTDPGLACPTIFHESWWLDIATAGQWAQVTHRENGAVGWMPYFISKAGPFRKIAMPAFTHFLGPVVSARSGSSPISFNAEVDVTRRLIEALPATSAFSQKFHRGIGHVVPFQMLGFDTSAQFTLEIEPRPTAELWSSIKPRTRSYIRAAETDLQVDEAMSSTEFRSFYVANLREKGREPADDMGIAARLIDACRERKRGYVLAARDRSRQPKAAIFCVSDSGSSYYLMTSRTHESGNGAVALLIWHAIQCAAAAGLIFDFDGFGHQSSIQFYSSFGGACRPRFTARRATQTFKYMRYFKSNFSGIKNKFVENN